MKYELNYDADACGTSYKGQINISYNTLVEIFGKPDPMQSDGYKTDAEWVIKFEDGSVATIYNWKDGYNYLGAEGLAVENITDWHIGGFDNKVVDYIKDIIHKHEEVE